MIRADGSLRLRLHRKRRLERRLRTEKMLTEICVRCDTIEKCYEFMLAYAAQGLSSGQGRQAGDEVRGYLHRALKAIAGLAKSCAMAVKQKVLQPKERYHAFFAVLDRDARDSLAPLKLLLS